MSLRNQTIIVTGASSGIGRMMALQFAREGANVVLAARSAPALEALAATISAAGGSALAVPTDVRRDDDVQNLVERTLAAFGTLDVLINNAGYGIFAPIESVDMPHIEGMINVNYFGTMRCIIAVLPVMRRQNRGRIINIASVAGLVSTPNTGAYSASKHAVVAATQAMQVELMGSPITCSLICPGPIDTPFFVKADYAKMSRLAKIFGRLDPDDVVNIIGHIVQHPRTMRVTPRAFHGLAIAYRLFPFLTKRVLRWVG
ncbi:MAG: SDR family oxidoreductase [Herpetosiphonaceae bacterium]|nr:SDR family oxidoreductase [Herpetosiphonaceae bacterium]